MPCSSSDPACEHSHTHGARAREVQYRERGTGQLLSLEELMGCILGAEEKLLRIALVSCRAGLAQGQTCPLTPGSLRGHPHHPLTPVPLHDHQHHPLTKEGLLQATSNPCAHRRILAAPPAPPTHQAFSLDLPTSWICSCSWFALWSGQSRQSGPAAGPAGPRATPSPPATACW